MLGNNIKKILAIKGMSVKDLSEALKISRTYLSYIINDKRKPSYELLEQIACTLNVTMDRLHGEALSGIIEERIKELGMTLEELAEKAQVSLEWLQSIDAFSPGKMDELEKGHFTARNAIVGGCESKSYDWVSKVAEVLNLPSARLRAALARQEEFAGAELREEIKSILEDSRTARKSIEASLSDQEIDLLNRFRKLNPTGQRTVFELINSLEIIERTKVEQTAESEVS